MKDEKGKMVTISIRLDSDLKNKMEKLCDDLGMSMSTAYTIFTKKCVTEQGLPFKVNVDPFYSKANQEFLKRSLKELEEGKGIKYNPFEDKEE